MSYPDPIDTPEQFLDHVKSLSLNAVIAAFTHQQNRPAPSPDGRLNEAKIQNWCDQMDFLIVSIHYQYLL
jgi:hypothetical protein